MTGERKIAKNLEGDGRGLIEIQLQHLPAGTEENHGTLQSGEPVSWPRFEPNILDEPARRVVSEKLTVTLLPQKLQAFHGIRKVHHRVQNSLS
jgi:hypothetical protein